MKCIYYVSAVIAISTAAFAPSSASAQINVNIVVPIAPPPVLVEAAPPPRVGYIWAPGYWRWDGGRYVWAEGRWERARDGHQYNPPAWRKDGDKWRFHEGGWKQAKHSKKNHPHGNGTFCPPGQAKKGNC
jgi:hypothetical protein